MKRKCVGGYDASITGQLTDYVGFVDYLAGKGYVARIDRELYAAVSVTGYWGITGTSIKYVLGQMQDHKNVKEMFCFDSSSELFRWLAEKY